MAMVSKQIINPKQAVILCGGLGTRMMPYTQITPKPMILCNEKPFLFYLLKQLHSQGINRFVLLTGYLSSKIINYFGDGAKWGWKIVYSDGPVEWDTGKRIWEAKSKLDDRFLLLYSDNFVQFSLKKIFTVHNKNKKAITLMLSSKRQGNVAISSSGAVKEYNNNRPGNNLDFVEIGYMVVEKDQVFSFYQSPDCNFSIVLEKMVASGQVGSMLQHDQYYSISDPKRWKEAEEYLKFKKIILIDRDGVINKKAHKGEYVSRWNEFVWKSDTRNAMKTLAKKGFKFIVVSNQAGISRKMIDLKDLKKIHVNMTKELLKDGIEILDIYVCPHHWDANCDCRKPKPGMLYKASAEWKFRLDKTLFIGDDYRDCQAAFNSGCKSVFIGKVDELENLTEDEKPIFTNKRLTACISNILEFFNPNISNDNY